MRHFLNKIFTLLDISWLTGIGLFVYNFFATAGEYAIKHEVGVRLTQTTVLFVIGLIYGLARLYLLWKSKHHREEQINELTKKPIKWWEMFK